VLAGNATTSHGINANIIRKCMPLYRDQYATALPAFEMTLALTDFG
jgi:hypothetical protein